MRLVLEDGTTFDGMSFGADAGVAGEVVFNTAMAGYVETLTDPSYRGQILVLTYPSVGNYGVPPDRPPDSLQQPFESDRVQVQGLIVQNYAPKFSHRNATRSLGEWLGEQGVPAMTGVDTRALTRHLRAAGTMKGRLIPAEGAERRTVMTLREVDMRCEVFRLVAPGEVRWYRGFEESRSQHRSRRSETYSWGRERAFGERQGGARRAVLLVDVGAKDNLVRSLLARGVDVVRVPWHENLASYAELADGVLIGNGPGDPGDLAELVDQVRGLMERGDKPIMGICLGNQILARAAGAMTYKLPYGHRGVNQPVQDLITRHCYITSQNHGFAVDHHSLPDDWEPWFVNLNDGSNEGIRSKTRPYFGVQFHPEAQPGPTDTGYLFDEFVRAVHRPAFA